MELSYQIFENHDFLTALSKVEMFTGLSINEAYGASKLIEWVRKEEKKARKAGRDLLEKYGVKDESGKYKAGPPPHGFALKKGLESDFEGDYARMVGTKFEVRFPFAFSGIDISHLEGAKLSPKEVGALEPILLGLEGDKND